MCFQVYMRLNIYILFSHGNVLSFKMFWKSIYVWDYGFPFIQLFIYSFISLKHWRSTTFTKLVSETRICRWGICSFLIQNIAKRSMFRIRMTLLPLLLAILSLGALCSEIPKWIERQKWNKGQNSLNNHEIICFVALTSWVPLDPKYGKEAECGHFP